MIGDNSTTVKGLGSMEHLTILGIRIDRVTMNEALQKVDEFVESEAPHIIVTADASAIVIAQDDPELREIINNADMVTPDSTGIMVVSKWYGSRLQEKVSGIDLVVEIAERAAAQGWSIFLFGAAPGIADKASETLSQRFPGLQIAGTQHGFFDSDDEVVNKIASSGARVLFVAMGIPKQEKWIKRYMDRLGVRVAMGVGGSFDVLSGQVNRAPLWMRNHGLEWAYRLASNPKKITKVATLPRFLWLVAIERLFRNRA